MFRLNKCYLHVLVNTESKSPPERVRKSLEAYANEAVLVATTAELNIVVMELRKVPVLVEESLEADANEAVLVATAKNRCNKI
jgi:hypothetical protein